MPSTVGTRPAEAACGVGSAVEERRPRVNTQVADRGKELQQVETALVSARAASWGGFAVDLNLEQVAWGMSGAIFL